MPIWKTKAKRLNLTSWFRRLQAPEVIKGYEGGGGIPF